MSCKICGGEAVFDLACEKNHVAAQICAGPMCRFDLWRTRPSEKPSVIPLMNGKCGSCDGDLYQVEKGRGASAYRFNNSSRPVFHAGYHQVQEYTGADAKSQVKRDAEVLKAAWQSKSMTERGGRSTSTDPAPNRCSGPDWNDIDEAMDVLGNIIKYIDEMTCTCWKVLDHTTKAVIGILVLSPKDELINSLTSPDGTLSIDGENQVWSGICYLAGHPKAKGAGEAMMAKTDEVHRASGADYMSVISAASAVPWYLRMGFEELGDSDCDENGEACGCKIMRKLGRR